MMEKLREQISTLADDELPEGEHELLVRRFAAEKALRVCWERYHLIGEAMREGLAPVDMRDFADRVMTVLMREPAAQAADRTGNFTRFSRAAAGLAVAASVAVVAIVGLRHDTSYVPQGAAPSEIVPPTAPLQTMPVSYGMVSNAAWNGNAPDVQAELRNYVINHNEFATSLTRQSMLPYMYINTYGTHPQSRPQESQHPGDQDKR